MTEPGSDFVLARTYQRVDNGAPVRLTLGRPEPDPLPGGDWRCRVFIEGLDHRVDRYAFGVDGLQALSLALEMARSYLQPNPAHAALVTWLEHPRLGLPRSLPPGVDD